MSLQPAYLLDLKQNKGKTQQLMVTGINYDFFFFKKP